MSKKLILASNNKGKIRELKELLEPFEIEVFGQREAGYDLDADESGATFAENAAIKARALYALCKCPVLADDSGLTVEALNGAPGVYSHRFAGENATDEERCQKLLNMMENQENRRAAFVCSLCYIDEKGKEYAFQGDVQGMIGAEPRGENGFGYDPVFYYGEKSFAQLSGEEKNQISHRGNALQQFCKWLNAEGEKYVNK